MDKKKKSARRPPAPKIKDLDVQQRKLAIIKQKQCDAIALNIVSKMIECRVEEDVFLQSLKYLNQCHYQDIVEERSIGKLCGYPICGKTIPDVPAKKFHISTKRNKVYDITHRKNYCSNFCYKAGIFIKDQMLTSPLWYRDRELVPDFHLLPPDETGISGQEIDQGLLKIDVEEEEEKIDDFTSVTQFTQDIINDIPEDVYSKINIEENMKKAKLDEETIKETQKSTLDEDLKKELITHKVKDEPINKTEFDINFSNLFAPSLADILKENAEYFESNNSVTQLSEPDNKSVNSTKPYVSFKPEPSTSPIFKITPQPSTSKDCKIGFDRTVINTNPKRPNTDSKSKGILKKQKRNTVEKKNAVEKKRVSFSRENSVQEIENLLDQKVKNPEKTETADTGSRFKNENVIGDVKERNTTYSTTTRSTKTIEKNVENQDKQEKRSNRLKNSSAFRKALSSAPKKSENLSTKLEKSLSEWFTFDSALFLYNETLIKEKISEKSFKHYLNKKKNLELDDKKQQQYAEICKRINLMELADQKFDETVTGRKRRPLPRYEDLRESAENRELKVQAFYSGWEVFDEDEDTDTESAKEDTEAEIEKGAPAVLPLIDNKDVMATRRRIFLTSVSRCIPNICDLLQDSPNRLLANIKHLLNTFQFTATNIVFKSSEWEFVTFLLIKILSIRDTELQKPLESNEMTEHFSLLLNKFSLSAKYVDTLLTQVKLENLLELCMKKDCSK